MRLGYLGSFLGRAFQNSEDLVLTHDQEFFDLPLSRSRVIISRVSQSLPIGLRVEIWHQAIGEYFSRDWSETVFEVFDDGKLLPWETRATGS